MTLVGSKLHYCSILCRGTVGAAIVLAWLNSSQVAEAAAGDLDPTFGTGGMVMTDSEFETFQADHATYNAIQIDENLHLVEQSEITQTLEGSMNHSCDSNVWMEDEVTLVARRDISTEEEITVDYALFTTQPNWMLDNLCQCGSLYCRHTITGNDWKLKDVQERYRNHFSPFINRRIENPMA